MTTRKTPEDLQSAGRPSKYNDDILVKAKEYLLTGYGEQGEVVPTQEGLALYIGIHRSTLHAWKAEEGKEKFSDILEECNQRQTILLMSGALTNDMNANIAKLMLGKHGYSEKNQTELTGANGSPIKTESKVEWSVQPVKPIDEA